LLKFLVGCSACESRAEVDVFRDLHGHKIKKDRDQTWMIGKGAVSFSF
jgi:hypothetical protein